MLVMAAASGLTLFFLIINLIQTFDSTQALSRFFQFSLIRFKTRKCTLGILITIIMLISICFGCKFFDII